MYLSYDKSYRERSPSRRSVRKSRDFTPESICNPYAHSLYIPPLLFYRILPDKTLCFQREKCSGGKISKKCLTILLCCNMLGKSETPLVIRKASKPRCFKNIDVRKPNVSWNSNKKEWMTTEIMSD
ncbi:hypothetical protein AVEN_193349-1 [Araneus ventricosus]|uniref:DDE-1 domain-containing protein n=1 Tax=Araneus ventricosus TaxID=182803 RepID=A0A4Y2ESD1_ARAVE|nr:hypothetical protein AVEN_193349-1 [Araneus ventricosus]